MIKYLFILCCCISSATLHATTLRASLPLLPKQSMLDDQGRAYGPLVDLVRAIDSVYREGDIELKLYPFARSIENVVTGRADFHLPLIKATNYSRTELPFNFSSEPLSSVVFVLYSRADKPLLNPDKLSQYKLSTQYGHKEFFPFAIAEDLETKQSFNKLLRHRTDGFIAAQVVGDSYIKKNKLKNIRRAYFATWQVHVVIPKGDKWQMLDKIISDALIELKASSRFAKITQGLDLEFEDWQPYQMPW